MYKRQPITIPKESREPKPWLMPSGISARADSQKNLRRVKIRILKNLKMCIRDSSLRPPSRAMKNFRPANYEKDHSFEVDYQVESHSVDIVGISDNYILAPFYVVCI